jgi:hypothetical protein
MFALFTHNVRFVPMLPSSFETIFRPTTKSMKSRNLQTQSIPSGVALALPLQSCPVDFDRGSSMSGGKLGWQDTFDRREVAEHRGRKMQSRVSN